MRVGAAVAVACLAIAGMTAVVQAQASIRKPINIEAQGLAPALQILAKDRKIQLVYRSELVEHRYTAGAAGDLTTEEALTQLLAGTGLTFQYLSGSGITIIPSSGSASVESAGGAAAVGGATQAGDTMKGGVGQGGEKEKSQTGDGFRVAQADQGQTSGSGSVASQQKRTAAAEGALQEVVVTAQKRTENLQDVPVPVSVISASQLIENSQVLLRDYYSSVPGLSITPAFQSTQQLTIRGITTGEFSNPTVGVVVDDVPFASSTQFGGGLVIPDLDPGDLQRIEVLRGPQGTLYGASSMGGLLKFVTIDPSTEGVSGHVQAGTSGVHNGSELGYNFRGSVNVPLGDTLAVRISGFARQDPGYIDNVVTGIDGVNEAHAAGGRLSALWRPTDSFSLKLSALYQHIYGDAPSEVDVPTTGYPETYGLKDLQQNTIPGVGPYGRTFQAYSATLNAKLGSVDLTSITGYNVNQFHDSFDFTYFLGPFTQNGVPGTGFNGFGVTGTSETAQNSTYKFTQEIRLSASIGPKFDWLLGGFYTHEHSPYVYRILALNPTGAPVGEWLYQSAPTNYAEYAAFADLTYHLTDRLSVQIGGRESHIDITTLPSYSAGPYNIYLAGLSSPYVAPEATAKANPFTYLLSPQFRVSSDLMVYARLASGYRAGGTNSANAPLREFSPDKTKNYELGVKGDFLNHVLSIDTSVYYIDWKGLQLGLVDPQTQVFYYGNAGYAKSQGIELSVDARPLSGLTIAGWVAWNEAVLTADLPSAVVAAGTYGVDGQRLPFSSRWSGSLSVDQQFPLSSSLTGFAGGAVSYVGDRVGNFQPSATPPPATYPAYAKVDLRAGTKYDTWTVNLYVNNVADKRGVLSGGPGFYPPYSYTYLQPRTVGLNILKTF